MGSETLIAAIITAIIGPIIVYYVTKQSYRSKKRKTFLNEDFGIKIISPKNHAKVNGPQLEITGVYSNIPPSESLRLFVVHPTRTAYGERIWPQEIVKEFFSETKTWRAKVHLAPGSGEEMGIVAAIVGQSVVVLWNYYYKVGHTVGWWDIEGWPDQAVIADRITIKIE